MVRPVHELEEHLYPHPTIVVGVGRFGLALLERLARTGAGRSKAKPTSHAATSV